MNVIQYRDIMRTIPITKIFLLLAFSALLLPSPALAIPPPDFVVNAGMQIAQMLGVALFFCSTGIAFLMRKFRVSIQSPVLRAVILLLLIGAFGLSWYLFQRT